MVFPKIIKDGMFTVGEKIGNGSFGDVFMATKQNGKMVAIKFEPQKAKKQYLGNEIEVGKLLIMGILILRQKYFILYFDMIAKKSFTLAVFLIFLSYFGFSQIRQFVYLYQHLRQHDI